MNNSLDYFAAMAAGAGTGQLFHRTRCRLNNVRLVLTVWLDPSQESRLISLLRRNWEKQLTGRSSCGDFLAGSYDICASGLAFLIMETKLTLLPWRREFVLQLRHVSWLGRRLTFLRNQSATFDGTSFNLALIMLHKHASLD